ncbi:hypothetical protein MAR_032885, partial [Mya arenaria]
SPVKSFTDHIKQRLVLWSKVSLKCGCFLPLENARHFTPLTRLAQYLFFSSLNTKESGVKYGLSPRKRSTLCTSSYGFLLKLFPSKIRMSLRFHNLSHGDRCSTYRDFSIISCSVLTPLFDMYIRSAKLFPLNLPWALYIAYADTALSTGLWEKCLSRRKCKSVNFDVDLRVCELNTASRLTAPASDVVDAVTSFHYTSDQFSQVRLYTTVSVHQLLSARHLFIESDINNRFLYDFNNYICDSIMPLRLDWLTGGPNSASERCGDLLYFENFDWNDATCGYSLLSICEKRLIGQNNQECID